MAHHVAVCVCTGIDAIVDPVAMAEFSVEDSNQDLLQAVLELMDIPKGGEFVSGMLLNAAWNGDIGCLQVRRVQTCLQSPAERVPPSILIGSHSTFRSFLVPARSAASLRVRCS